jgi:ABC-2 type transport system ATP-binding protein
MIEVRGLTKKYGARAAVSDISFSVNAGEVVGFLGPNGAGKTTTMNILTGFLAATQGDVRIDGVCIVESPALAKKNIGYMPDTPPVYGDMRVLEYLNFVADIKKVPKTGRRGHLAEIMEQVKIADMGRRVIKNLSRGYRQRVGLAQAMVGHPKVLILDEPTIGLDPGQIMEMREVIRNLGSSHTVILSSHIMQEVAAVCDRVVIINRGEIVASGTPAELAAQLGGGDSVRVRVKASREEIERALRGLDYEIEENMPLEEIFLRLTGGAA